MTQGRRPLIPEWAVQERLSDLAWIQENLDVFWPAAQAQYRRAGRGAIVVDTTIRPTGAGNPFTYLAQAEVDKTLDHEAQRIVREYDPDTEMVIVLFKQKGRISVYRCRPMK